MDTDYIPSYAEEVNQLPPHDQLSEQTLLGCAMLSDEVADEILSKTVDKHFFDMRHRDIFNAIQRLRQNGVTCDVLHVQSDLQTRLKLTGVGGYPYLTSLADSPPTATVFDYFWDNVDRMYRLRRVQECANKVLGEVYNPEEDPDELHSRMENVVREYGQPRVEEKTIQQLTDDAIVRAEYSQAHQGAILGLPTGFPDFDQMTMGIKPGEVIVLAARPGMGKTTLALNIAEHVAMDAGHHVGIFSLEMSAESLTDRLIASRSRVNFHTTAQGLMTEQQMVKWGTAAHQIHTANRILICDDRSLTVPKLASKARVWAEKHDLRLVVIDYLQLLNSDARKVNRQEQISDMSRGIKIMAGDLKVPVLLLGQLNRDIEKDKGRRPRLSDLRESGSIEQDADVVAFLHPIQTDDPNDTSSLMELIIGKQRSGPIGSTRLLFLKQFTRFESVPNVHHDPQI